MVNLPALTTILTGLSAALASPHALLPRDIPHGSLQQVTNSGISNPTNVGFYVYVPNKVVSNPGIIVAIHYCTGTASAYYTNTPYAQLAETYGFIVIYPQSPYSGTCWDVSSTSSLTHNGGGNSNSIANMVTYITQQYSADTSKVFVTGTSSGAMMTVS
jgi:acetylxylan esterase